jgi:prepilin-type N-terminal cleavage/methylation domain-containing protein
MSPGRSHAGRHGFTLVELLAALAIASVIIAATAALVHNVALHFDRGTRGVSEEERLVLAVERLAVDFGSARFVLQTTEAGTALAFTGEPASSEASAKIVFVGAGGIASGPQGEEVVNLTIEQDGDVTRLVRRRAAWFGPRTRLADLTLSDPVILLEGNVDIVFAFGRVNPDGALAWSDGWKGELTLPRFVRLILRDRATGANRLAGAEFVVRADAPGACAQGDAAAACLSGSAAARRRRTDG